MPCQIVGPTHFSPSPLSALVSTPLAAWRQRHPCCCPPPSLPPSPPPPQSLAPFPFSFCIGLGGTGGAAAPPFVFTHSSAAGPPLCSLRSPPPTASVFPWPKHRLRRRLHRSAATRRSATTRPPPLARSQAGRLLTPSPSGQVATSSSPSLCRAAPQPRPHRLRASARASCITASTCRAAARSGAVAVPIAA